MIILEVIPGSQLPDHLPPAGSLKLLGVSDSGDDKYTQLGLLFRLMTPAQQQVLFEKTARNMEDVPVEVRLGLAGNCMKADLVY